MSEFNSENLFVRKTFIVLASVLLAIAASTVFVLVIDQFLIILFAVLLSVPMSGFITLVKQRLHISYTFSFALVWLVLFGLVAVLGYFSASTISSQISTYSSVTFNVQEQVENLPAWIPNSLISEFNNINILEAVTSGRTVQSVENTAAAIFGGLTGSIIFTALVIYISLSPKQHKKGLLIITPARQRPTVEELLKTIPSILNWWMVSRVFSMVAVGVLTYIGLLILNVEAALLLSITAGLLAFIPNLGPILSVIPAILLSLPQGVLLVAWVIGLYVFVQFVESYFITPFVQKKAVSVTPALLLSVQIVFGALFGLLGLLIAGPITAIAVGLVQEERSGK